MGKEKFIMGELFGFVLLVSGTLVYNEIIEIPITFLNQNTKRNLDELEQRKKQALEQKKEEGESDFEKASPHKETSASSQKDEINEDEKHLLDQNK